MGSGVASYGALGHVSPSTSNSESQLSKYCAVCEISWCRCQQLTALLISTASVTKLLVIEQLLHPALKSTVSAHDIISIFAPPRNKSWRRHCIWAALSETKLIFDNYDDDDDDNDDYDND